MTADDYAHAIAQEARAAVEAGASRRAIGYLSDQARQRVRSAGLEYQRTDAVQGFEVRHPTDLVCEIEDELADAMAWAVALKLRMKQAGHDVSIRAFLTTLAELQQDMAGWWTDARGVE